MAKVKPTRKYNGETYTHYMMTGTKHEAKTEVMRLRRTGRWKARIAKVKGGYIIFTRPK